MLGSCIAWGNSWTDKTSKMEACHFDNTTNGEEEFQCQVGRTWMRFGGHRLSVILCLTSFLVKIV